MTRCGPLLLALGLATPAAADDLVVVAFGGAGGAATERYMADPFTDATGIPTRMAAYNGGQDGIRAQVAAGADVIAVEGADLGAACEQGLLVPLPDPPEDFLPPVSRCGWPIIVWASVVAFDRDRLDGEPATIADFFDLDRFPGKRGLRRRAYGAVEWALAADGVPLDRVYRTLATPEGQARAFAKLDTIRHAVVWFDTWSEPNDLLHAGEVVMSQSTNGRARLAGQAILWDAHLYDVDSWAVASGVDFDRAMRFIRFATEAEPLARRAAHLSYGPGRQASVALIDPDVREHLPTAHLDEGLRADAAFWADHGERLEARFAAWLRR